MSIPVHIITGFLGAGKTSLMNHLLRNVPSGVRVALVVNELGRVAIDGALVERGSYRMKELYSGCICCTLAGPLTDSLGELVVGEEPNLILMESTGVARPEQIAALLADRKLAGLVHCGNILCVVDAAVLLRLVPSVRIVEDQLKCANTVLLNKTDLVTPETLDAVRSRVETLTPPDCRVVACEHGRIDISLLLEEHPVYFTTVSVHGRAHAHHSPGHDLTSVSIEMKGCFEYDAFLALIRTIQSDVVRAKGFVNTDRGSKLFQLSLSGFELSDWRGEVTVSRLVFIGKELNECSIEAQLSAALSQKYS